MCNECIGSDESDGGRTGEAGLWDAIQNSSYSGILTMSESRFLVIIEFVLPESSEYRSTVKLSRSSMREVGSVYVLSDDMLKYVGRAEQAT